MYPSNIRERIKNNDLLLSTSMFTREPHNALAIFYTNPDWTWIDQEHSPWGTESIGLIAILARQAGVAGVIRVPWNSPAEIKKAYDVGAVGVMVPQVDSPEEVLEAIKYAKYPPMGERGIAPWFAEPMGVSRQDIIDNSNSETMLIIQMESMEAYERIDETLAIKDFEVLLVGPTDLSASLGFPGEIHHPKVEQIMSDVAQKIKGTGKALATTFADPEDARRWIREGYRMMNVGSVMNLGINGTRKYFAEFREEFS